MKLVFLCFSLFYTQYLFGNTFKVAFPDENYPPYHFSKEKNGILNQIVARFAEVSSNKMVYVLTPKLRSEKLLKKGIVDARMDSKEWVQDASAYYWSNDIAYIEDVIVVARNVVASDFKQVKGGILLGRFGYTYYEYDNLVKGGFLHRENFYSDIEILNSLNRHSSSTNRFTIISKDLFYWYVKNHPKFRYLRVSDFNVGVVPIQFQFAHTAKGKKLADAFNAFLKELRDSGELAKIIASYQ
jgi:ABC-type amino acid transport substrate-binding protein